MNEKSCTTCKYKPMRIFCSKYPCYFHTFWESKEGEIKVEPTTPEEATKIAVGINKEIEDKDAGVKPTPGDESFVIVDTHTPFNADFITLDNYTGIKQFMKTDMVIVNALKMDFQEGFIVTTPKGSIKGKPGDYLVWEPDGNKWSYDKKEFEQSHSLIVRKPNKLPSKFDRVGFGNWPRFITVNNIIKANCEDKAEILMINIDEIETIEPTCYISDGLTHAVIQMTSGNSYSVGQTVEQIMKLIQEECVSPQSLGE